MVIDHRNKTPEMMEVLQNEWTAYCPVKIAPYHRALDIKRLKRKLEVLTVALMIPTIQSWSWKLPGLNLKQARNAKNERMLRREEGGSAAAK
jgi:hypothetical protein